MAADAAPKIGSLVSVKHIEAMQDTPPHPPTLDHRNHIQDNT